MTTTIKSVVVTGANGFIGHYCLAPLIDLGFNIHCFSRKKSGVDKNGIKWHQIDLLNQSAMSLLEEIQPTHLLHLAWCTEHGAFWTSEDNIKWLETSKRLFDDFQKIGGLRFVFSGSCAEYQWGGHLVEGQTPDEPATLYGRCKRLFTDYIHAGALDQRISTATGRVFFLYGPGEPKTRLMPNVISAQLRGNAVRVSDGTQIRDFMYVEDVAYALVALLNSNVEGTVNIASGSPTSIRQVIEEISNQLMPRQEVEFGAIPRAANDPDVLTASTLRLNKEVGYYPKTPLKAGLKSTINWLKASAED